MSRIIIAEPAVQAVFQAAFAGIDVQWVGTPGEAGPADFVFDLSFDAALASNATSAGDASNAISERVSQLAAIQTGLVLVNAVAPTLKELAAPAHFARINGWNTFLQRGLAEVVAGPEALPLLEAFCTAWSKSPVFLPDNPGMPSARIVSMIINEAFYALGEGVSTADAINTAMKLGTNYPFGPFEWCDLIGRQRILSLLQRMEKENPRYTIAPLLCH